LVVTEPPNEAVPLAVAVNIAIVGTEVTELTGTAALIVTTPLKAPLAKMPLYSTVVVATGGDTGVETVGLVGVEEPPDGEDPLQPARTSASATPDVRVKWRTKDTVAPQSGIQRARPERPRHGRARIVLAINPRRQ
jgi:hypothetical protein